MPSSSVPDRTGEMVRSLWSRAAAGADRARRPLPLDRGPGRTVEVGPEAVGQGGSRKSDDGGFSSTASSVPWAPSSPWCSRDSAVVNWRITWCSEASRLSASLRPAAPAPSSALTPPARPVWFSPWATAEGAPQGALASGVWSMRGRRP